MFDHLPSDTPELVLSQKLAQYGALRMRHISTLPAHKAAIAKLAYVGLQQRLAVLNCGVRAHPEGPSA
jgi:hypothetical protein